MDAKKQAYIADALEALLKRKIPMLEAKVADPFMRSLIPPVPPSDVKEAAAEAAATAAQASDTWDKEHGNG